MARPTKYRPDVVKRITDAIAVGATYEHAAQHGQISYDTFNEWRQSKPEFAEAVSDADARFVVGQLAKIERAGNEGAWRAAAWKLERRFPQAYGRQAPVPAPPAPAPDVVILSEEDLEALIAAATGTDQDPRAGDGDGET